jgi:hypothetical protein
VALAGPSPAFAIDAASFAISTLTSGASAVAPSPPRPTPSRRRSGKARARSSPPPPRSVGSRPDTAPPDLHRTGAPGHPRRPGSRQPGSGRLGRGGAASPGARTVRCRGRGLRRAPGRLRWRSAARHRRGGSGPPGAPSTRRARTGAGPRRACARRVWLELSSLFPCAAGCVCVGESGDTLWPGRQGTAPRGTTH